MLGFDSRHPLSYIPGFDSRHPLSYIPTIPPETLGNTGFLRLLE